MKRYCEYKACGCRNKKLPPFKGNDRRVRFLHKKCYKEHREYVDLYLNWTQEIQQNMPNYLENLIEPNPLNIPIEKCLRCGEQNEDTKNGYCPAHNTMSNWVMYG